VPKAKCGIFRILLRKTEENLGVSEGVSGPLFVGLVSQFLCPAQRGTAIASKYGCCFISNNVLLFSSHAENFETIKGCAP